MLVELALQMVLNMMDSMPVLAEGAATNCSTILVEVAPG